MAMNEDDYGWVLANFIDNFLEIEILCLRVEFILLLPSAVLFLLNNLFHSGLEFRLVRIVKSFESVKKGALL